VDLAATREESYPHPGTLPEVRCGVPIERDLERRDFTIHAMALRLGRGGAEGDLLDPLGGRSDLALRRIRLLHSGSLADDPTRAFRAARYAARLGFELDAGFWESMRRSVQIGAFARISGDRLRRGLIEVLSEDNRSVAMALLERLGVLEAVVPGWTLDGRLLGDLAAAGTPEDSLARVLSPLSGELRGAVARRLGFSRALRRRTGCPP
jgi:tRNA nucleotidyltransferase/poly(A) polymerase